MFQRCNNYRGKIDRKKFREFLHDNLDMTDDIIMDRVYKYFNTEAKDDIDLEEWILGFNVILKGGLTLLCKTCNFLKCCSSC